MLWTGKLGSVVTVFMSKYEFERIEGKSDYKVPLTSGEMPICLVGSSYLLLFFIVRRPSLERVAVVG